MAEKGLHCCTKRRKISSSELQYCISTTNNTSNTATPPQKNTWCDLPLELLELIVKNFAFFDHLRFKSVCSSWLRAAKSFKLPPAPPMIVLTSSHNSVTTFSLFSIAEKKCYKINKVFQGFHDLEARCAGSSFGWLAIWNEDLVGTCLFNPFAGRTIQLPLLRTRTLHTKWEKFDDTYIKKVVVSSDPSRNDNFIVVVIPMKEKLKFYKHGTGGRTKTWTSFGGNTEDDYRDAIFSDDGQQLVAFNCTNGGDKSVQVWYFGKADEHPVKTGEILLDNYYHRSQFTSYLVVSMGEILLVEVEMCKTLVYEISFENKRLTKVDRLKDRAVCLHGGGSAGAISVSTREFPEFKDNSIYDASTRRNIYHRGHFYIVNKIGVKNLENGRLIWVVPNV